MTSASTSRRQLDAGTLDAKVVKALKKQEEKREKRASRKKEVSIKIELLNNSKRIEKFSKSITIIHIILDRLKCFSGKNFRTRNQEKARKILSWLKKSKLPEKILVGTLGKSAKNMRKRMQFEWKI